MRIFLQAVIAVVLLFGFVFGANSAVLLYNDDNRTEFEISFGSISIENIGGGYSLFSLPDYGYRGDENGPWLLGRAYNIAVRRDDDVKVSIVAIEWSDWLDIVPAPLCSLTMFEKIPGYADAKLYSQHFGGTADIAYDYIERGVRIIGIDVLPVEYDPSYGVRFMKRITISVEHTGGNSELWSKRLYHPAFAQMFRAILVNWKAVIPTEPMSSCAWNPDSGAELLVIADPALLDEAEPWLEWKLLMGMPTIVATVDTIGSDTTALKAFIQNAYDTWAMPPTFVLFVGDAEVVPTYNGYYTGCTGDNDYGTVDGDDIIPDILPGRMSADYSSEMQTIVQKHINYEKEPDTIDDWYARAVGVVREEDCPYDGGPVDSSYLAAVSYAMEQCLEAGYSFAHMFTKCSGDNASTVRPYLEAGCNFADYRGQAVHDWWDPFGGLLDEPTGKRLPIFVSITCATGSFQDDGYPCENVTRDGTASNPRGGVAWYGQSRCSVNSVERSSLSKHIFEGFFEAKLNWLAAADTYGKNGMLDEFGPTSAVLYEYLSSTLLGSPEMMAWTAPIQTPDIDCPDAIPWGFNTISVGVSVSGEPVENARVCFHQGDSLIYNFTDSTGSTYIDIDVDAFTPLLLVVTGPNIYPTIDTIEVLTGGVILVSAPSAFTDIVGDGDGLLNPGETIAFTPMITNRGDDTAEAGYTCIVRTNDPEITFVDSISTLPAIASNDTAFGDSVIFEISEEHFSSDRINFTMLIISPDLSDTVERNIVSHPPIYRFLPEIGSVIIYDDPPFGDGDGQIEPGEQVDVSVKLRNSTQADAFNLSAELLAWSELSIVQPTCEYAELLRDSSALPEYNFSMEVSRDAPPGLEFSLNMILSADCNTYSYYDTLEVPLSILGEPTRLPTGPDEYGYYIIDDTDILDDLVPTFEWNDISDDGRTIEEITDSDDGIATIPLPFTFSFYGHIYDSISVSSNGFLAPEFCGWSGPGTGTPQRMPHIGGPAGIIAAMWSDLAPMRPGGDIFSYYDEENSQFVIQYDSVEFYSTGGYVSMQVRICDADDYPTPTGDNEIFVYYKDILNPVNYGVGIESPDETNGLQYYFLGDYDEHSAPIEPERALRITTNIPTFGNAPWVSYLDSLNIDDTAGDCDGIIEPGDIIAMCFRLKNSGNSAANNVNAFAVSSDIVSSASYIAHFGTIVPGDTAYNEGSPVVFEISSACPADTVLMIPIAISANSGGYADTIGIPIQVGGDVSSIGSSRKPSQASLIRIHPNPFNSRASLEIFIAGNGKAQNCDISIFALNGRKVMTIFSGAISHGKHIFTIDGNKLKSGIYLIKSSVGDVNEQKKILLLK